MVSARARDRRIWARHARRPPRRTFEGLFRFLRVAAGVVLLSSGGVAAYVYYDLTSSFAANAQQLEGQETTPPDISALVAETGVDLLLTGIDVCEWDSHEKFGDRCPSEAAAYGADGRQLDSGLNDVNLFVHISPEPRRITVVAFPRDLMGPAPECTSTNTGDVIAASDRRMLNEAYANGGLACVAKTVDAMTASYDPRLAIDYAATVTWNGVIEITSAIGGVDVCVGETIDDVEAGMLYLEGGRTHTLQGEEALALLRARKSIGNGGDLSRISNQQVYMSSLARKLMSEEILADPRALLSLARTTLRNVDPSESLTNPITLVQLALAGKAVPLSDIVFVQYPVVPDPIDPENRVASDDAAAADLFAAIAANEAVKPENPAGEHQEASGGGQASAPGEEEAVAPGESMTPDPDSAGTVVAVPGRTALDSSCANPSGG